MRILIRPRDMTAGHDLRQQVDECLTTALDPVREDLAGVDVYLTDVNGPRGGPDKHCRVVAHRRRGRPVVVSRTAGDPMAAVTGAAGRCRQSLRSLSRRRLLRRRPRFH